MELDPSTNYLVNNNKVPKISIRNHQALQQNRNIQSLNEVSPWLFNNGNIQLKEQISDSIQQENNYPIKVTKSFIFKVQVTKKQQKLASKLVSSETQTNGEHRYNSIKLLMIQYFIHSLEELRTTFLNSKQDTLQNQKSLNITNATPLPFLNQQNNQLPQNKAYENLIKTPVHVKEFFMSQTPRIKRQFKNSKSYQSIESHEVERQQSQYTTTKFHKIDLKKAQNHQIQTSKNVLMKVLFLIKNEKKVLSIRSITPPDLQQNSPKVQNVQNSSEFYNLPIWSNSQIYNSYMSTNNFQQDLMHKSQVQSIKQKFHDIRANKQNTKFLTRNSKQQMSVNEISRETSKVSFVNFDNLDDPQMHQTSVDSNKDLMMQKAKHIISQYTNQEQGSQQRFDLAKLKLHNKFQTYLRKMQYDQTQAYKKLQQKSPTTVGKLIENTKMEFNSSQIKQQSEQDSRNQIQNGIVLNQIHQRRPINLKIYQSTQLSKNSSLPSLMGPDESKNQSIRDLNNDITEDLKPEYDSPRYQNLRQSRIYKVNLKLDKTKKQNQSYTQINTQQQQSLRSSLGSLRSLYNLNTNNTQSSQQITGVRFKEYQKNTPAHIVYQNMDWKKI